MSFKKNKLLYILAAIVLVLYFSGEQPSIKRVDCKLHLVKRYKYVRQVRLDQKDGVKFAINSYLFNLIYNTRLSKKEMIECVKQFKKMIKE